MSASFSFFVQQANHEQNSELIANTIFLPLYKMASAMMKDKIIIERASYVSVFMTSVCE